ncbi:MAG: ABC-2 family transporter protein [Anaerolineae bacterium]|nr:ABC-2 family transporter protein [Anaerolineae bacterium]
MDSHPAQSYKTQRDSHRTGSYPELNLRGGWALIKNTWSMWLQHRGFFFLLAFGWMIQPLIYLLVWSTAAGGGEIGGINRGEFVAYYLVLILVNQLTYAQVNWTVGDEIRYGGMNRILLRPLAPIFDALSSELAGKVVYMLFGIPVTVLLAVILRPELHLTWQNSLVFIPALLCAWALRFFWGYWLALLAFWSTRADALLALQDSMVFLLAGQVAPVVLLPGVLHQAAIVLPFRYMLGFPVEILTGQLDISAVLTGFFLQLSWLAATLILFVVVWRAGLQRYSSVGG